ncbi:bacteriophage T4 gp5 trimerization domain-containing protein, partial [Marivita sp. S0852]|uniref:bacteriophage T4 gp5 trimerisation domain-containing protein n=1 Tax=Marivita sp. S0852 TaxID=3373893 RepID=UPI003981A899
AQVSFAYTGQNFAMPGGNTEWGREHIWESTVPGIDVMVALGLEIDREDGRMFFTFRMVGELTFEDERGREEVFLRASRDLTVKVDNHATSRVTCNSVTSIGGYRLTEVEKSDSVNIGTSFAMTVGDGAGGSIIDGKERDDPFGLRPAAYAIDMTPHVGGRGSYSVSASGVIRFDTDASFSVDVDKSASERISETKIVNVGRDYRVSV